MRKTSRQALWGLLSVLLVGLAWSASSHQWLVVEQVVGSPTRAMDVARAAFLNDGVLWDIALTLRMFAAGLALATILGCGAGLLVGRSRLGVLLAEIPLSVANTLPLVALIPPLIVLIGTTTLLRVFVTFLAAFIPIVWNVAAAARQFPRDLERTGRVFGVSGAPFLRKMLLPYITPYLATGVRLGAGRGIVTLLVTEMYVQGYGGIGAWLAAARVNVDPNLAVFVTLLSGLLGVGLMSLFSLVERLLAPWRAL